MHARITLMLGISLAISGFVGSLRADEITPAQLEFFEQRIRPVLADHCYRCHSVAQGKARGGLTLDTRDGVLKGGNDGPVIVPGDPTASRLITAVRGSDPASMMPPKSVQKRPTPEQIANLAEWVKMGAPVPHLAAATKAAAVAEEASHHWSYRPVGRPTAPAVKDAGWPLTTVDNFILAKLEAQGMTPAPPADKETLLRRATFDLTGLPPTPEEIAAFLADERPDAFATVVDRLLASPHYGERWGRHWLDTVRYSDTSGYVSRDNDDYRFPYAWTYRDYVIRSLNDDKPYDRFIMEQLAADLLGDLDDRRSLAALGLITVGHRNGGANDIIDDRIDTVSKAFLAMTVSCARCHDHKFDPIPTTDYYALHGVFNSIAEPSQQPVIAEPSAELEAEFAATIAPLHAEDVARYYEVAAEFNRTFRQKAGLFIMAALLASRGDDPDMMRQAIEINTRENLDRTTVGFLRLVSHRLHTFNTNANRRIFRPAVAFVGGPRVQPYLRDELQIHPQVAEAMSGIGTPRSWQEIADVYTRLFQSIDAKADAFVAALAAARSDQDPLPVDADTAALLQIPIAILPAYQLTPEKLEEQVQQAWPGGYRFLEWNFAKKNELELTHAGSGARAMTVVDRRPQEIHNSHVLIRGEIESKGEVVPRHFLTALSHGAPKPFTKGSGRLELAQAIANRDNPLTARVLVNRVWMHHFGEGFVPTPDDLGTMADSPSHPELLDHLASTFMDQGWSLKKLHRLIMLSQVYQMSSRTVADYERKDPTNRLLWRANVRRLDFESVRDTLLTISGRLDRSIGGRPVNLTDEPYSTRRSVYGYVDRGNLPDLLTCFDFSNPEAPNSKRNSTIVPQQALFFMNNPMAIDVARSVMARPEVTEAKDDAARVFSVYRVVFQRAPTAEETRSALDFIRLETEQAGEVHAWADEVMEGANKKAADRLQRALTVRFGSGASLQAIHNTGDLVERATLSPWETWVHALLMSNEVAFVL